MNTVWMIKQGLPELISLGLEEYKSLGMHDWVEGAVIEDSQTKAILMTAM